ncbi:MAG: ABC transporter permease [Planctomycetota bacterium]|nr:ABC transporter permease [Planctomycetota bacterium]
MSGDLTSTRPPQFLHSEPNLSILGFFNPLKMVANLFARRELLWQFTVREVQGRYRGSYLGMFWALINPLLTLMVYTFVFHVIFNAKWDGNNPNENFMVYAMNMFSGIVAFTVFSESVIRAPMLVVQNPNFVKKVVFPLELLPLSLVGAALIHSLLGLMVLLVGAACGAGSLHWTLIFLPVVFLPLAILTAGLCWILSSLGVFLRDIGNIVQVAVQLLFFLTPITYPLSRLSLQGQRVMLLNPLALMIVNIRRVVNFGAAPEWKSYFISLTAASVVAILGYAWFMKIKRAFADVI